MSIVASIGCEVHPSDWVAEGLSPGPVQAVWEYLSRRIVPEMSDFCMIQFMDYKFLSPHYLLGGI